MYHFATDVLKLRSVERGQQRALLTSQQQRSFAIFITATVSNNWAFSAHSYEEEREIRCQTRPGVALFQHRTSVKKCTVHQPSVGFIEGNLGQVHGLNWIRGFAAGLRGKHKCQGLNKIFLLNC
jgi:hypothetical protein